MQTQITKQYLTPAQLEKRLQAFRKEMVQLNKDVIEYLEWKSYGGNYNKVIEPRIATPEIRQLAKKYRSLITKKSYGEERSLMHLRASENEV